MCQYCSACVCQDHRVLSGHVGYDDEGKARGGVNCQCNCSLVCTANQKRVMQFLDVPEGIELFIQPKAKVKGVIKGGKSKCKGQGKDEAGKGESSSSSSSVWRPQ